MRIAFLFYDGMTTLDIIGPHEVLARLPGVTVHRVAKQAGVIQNGLGLKLIADYSLSEVAETDILVIPGGGKATSLSDEPEILDWIRSIHRDTQWTTSVCTGSLILGAAGLLQGKKATTHWAVMDRLKHWGAMPVTKRIVEDGKIITAAGVSAGIDMALLLAAKLAGKEAAETLQLGIEYDPEPPFNAGSPVKAGPAIYQPLQKRLLDIFEKV
ncbi:4-methyl-5(B-hydroxyethyl)-thiazole monophosphate biosynthesis enzyme [Legionella birminghamensis]|uniref:4-methyl-5(B-hydroxyethyl)-thiazole monophosphate biosynthesis enzyme n=1 Tax=Legionella birminghamensis TaxID=28083 RepID=A0A378IBE7_9GAMM|nr:DJ-1/PfpI family protein [Legionella birminghamensis]KTC75969.1 4-methyl-5(B-hydroxyethyl)-thiazole monophosphate biosynthesis enzyme [Legionella birminghamensis]STX32095.1 4-methyl-5(B-hydroxyethyl)-thiazole monophosphate biosynthesis enzyme [Legionella birminghamensis]